MFWLNIFSDYRARLRLEKFRRKAESQVVLHYGLKVTKEIGDWLNTNCQGKVMIDTAQNNTYEILKNIKDVNTLLFEFKADAKKFADYRDKLMDDIEEKAAKTLPNMFPHKRIYDNIIYENPVFLPLPSDFVVDEKILIWILQHTLYPVHGYPGESKCLYFRSEGDCSSFKATWFK